MRKTFGEMLITISFSFAVLYALFLSPYVELCRTGKYDGSVTVSGNYTEWEIVEARTDIHIPRVDGKRHYIVSEMWLDGKHFGLDCPELTPGKETKANDYDGNFWYVFLSREQARIPTQRLKTALLALLAYLCALSGDYWLYWEPRLTAEKETEHKAKEVYQEKVREMEELKATLFDEKRGTTEVVQEEKDPFENIFKIQTPEERAQMLASETPEERKAREAREAENRARWKEESARFQKYDRMERKLREALLAEEKRTGLEIPFLLRLRYGLTHILPPEGENPPDTSESENESPEMAYYRRFAENLMPKLEAEQENS